MIMTGNCPPLFIRDCQCDVCSHLASILISVHDNLSICLYRLLIAHTDIQIYRARVDGLYIYEESQHSPARINLGRNQSISNPLQSSTMPTRADTQCPTRPGPISRRCYWPCLLIGRDHLQELCTVVSSSCFSYPPPPPPLRLASKSNRAVAKYPTMLKYTYTESAPENRNLHFSRSGYFPELKLEIVAHFNYRY